MFQYDANKLNAIVTQVLASVDAQFPEDANSSNDIAFVLPAVIGKLLSKSGHNTLNWSIDYYIAPQWQALIPALLELHASLVKYNRDMYNEFLISSCDRYACFVPNSKKSVIFFRNQNYAYVVRIEEDNNIVCKDDGSYDRVPTWVLEVRVLTQSRYDITPLNVYSVNDINLDEISNGANDYFRYGDTRDRGYIINLNPSIISKNELFYTTNDYSHGNPLHNGVLDELSAYVSMIDEIKKELDSGT